MTMSDPLFGARRTPAQLKAREDGFMFRTSSYGLAVSAFLMFAVIAPGCAEEPVDTAQSIIRNQIAAFLNDDAATAYSFASPAIQGKFLN